MKWLLLLLLMAGCAKPTPEKPCGFLMTEDAQRMSWGSNLPIVIGVDSSVPETYYEAIYNSMNRWNQVAGRELFAPGRSQNTITYVADWKDKETIQAFTRSYVAGDRVYQVQIFLNANRLSSIDFESLMMHELGHVLGLAHSDSVHSVMHPILHNGEIRREPLPSDIENMHCEY